MIMANVLVAFNTEYHCTKCKKRYLGDDKKQAEHFRLKGCDGERQFLVAQNKKGSNYSFLPDLKFTKCPANWTNNSFQELIKMYGDFKNGLNYYGLPPAITPAKYYEAMNLIGTLIENEHEVKQEIAKKLNKLRAGRGKK